MSTPLERKSDLLGRAAESQRRNGKLPDTRTDDVVWSGILEEIERKAAVDRPAKPVLDRNPARSAEEALQRSGAELVGARDANKALRRLSPRRGKQTVEAKLACRRLRILALMPEWQRQVIAAMDEGARKAMTLGGSMRLLIWLEVRKVLDASDAALGSKWERLPEHTKVSVSG